MPIAKFHPVTLRWFEQRFRVPTEPQRLGWPEIIADRNTLIAAPTGSGKTLAAFLACIDRLLRQGLEGSLADTTQVVYVSPLKALSNDVRRNLDVPLGEIRETARADGCELPPLRVLVRTGDTPAAERQAMTRRPPHILVTTPESLYLLLTATKGREMLRTTRTVVVDEIHALARDKRGSHLALSLERLEALCESPPVRIGLSATVRPVEEMARFLVGRKRVAESGQPQCSIVNVGHVRQLDLGIEVPPSELSAVCSLELWDEIYRRLTQLIQAHRSTLVFVNTRRLAERVCHRLTELLGPDAVASHHGSLSKEIRLAAEERLKNGQLKAIIATASLELGIDIGFIDLVCQIGSPRSIATFLQRVGRSGHPLGVIPKGRLFALTRDELIESLALVRAVRQGRLDAVEIPRGPLDILAQQIVSSVACEEWNEDALYELCRSAWPYRELNRADFDAVVQMLNEGNSPGRRRGTYLHRDAIDRRLRARRGARIAAVTSGGAIPETADYRVITEDETYVGTVNEDFAIESMAGDIFLLGNTSWRVQHVRAGQMVVTDAQGAPATIPFWLGEAPARTPELSAEVSELRDELARRVEIESDSIAVCGEHGGPSQTRPTLPSCRHETKDERRKTEDEGTGTNDRGEDTFRLPASDPCLPTPESAHETKDKGEYVFRPPSSDSSVSSSDSRPSSSDSRLPAPQSASLSLQPAVAWLQQECGVGEWPALQACQYVAGQKAAIGLVPTQQQVVFERFFDESGGMQLVIHAPFGARINRAWGLALRKRFCRRFDFELQASADDNGIVLSIGPQHSFPIEQMFELVNPQNAEYLLTQALLAVPMFLTRWRWNATRALAVLRQHAGKKVPPPLLRMRSDDLLTAVFPAITACQENQPGDITLPDHPLVEQTIYDCLHEAMDLDRWLKLLDNIEHSRVQLVARDTREPSPFSYQLLNANPYAFLDDAPLEERRARAVATRRTLTIESVRDLGRLDPEAIAQVRAEAWPVVRDADELHDALLLMGALPACEGGPWAVHFRTLVADGRATETHRADGPDLWVAAECWPLVHAAFPDAVPNPPVSLPDSLASRPAASEAWIALVRGRLECLGPQTASQIGKVLGLPLGHVEAALEALEGEGFALRGQFTGPAANDCRSQIADRRLKEDFSASPESSQSAICNLQSAIPEWCERRLLARIHRLTLEGLRRQIQPVTPTDFIRFLLEFQHLTPRSRLEGRDGVLQAIAQLQGFEIPAGAWEHEILPGRVSDYDPAWLDDSTLSGQVVWGRLQPPRKAEADGPAASPLTRAVPVALVRREDLAWLLAPERAAVEDFVRTNARLVLETLSSRGALFLHDLQAITGLLPAQMEEALLELAALGLVTADGFAAIRSIVSPDRRWLSQLKRRRVRRGRHTLDSAARGGRWSLFPGLAAHRAASGDSATRIEQWAHQLLRRYGVVFRDLLARETVAPPWRLLSPVLRRLEARGEIRGGRFVSGVGGEQFATSEAVTQLRRIRDERPSDDNAAWVIISASDPANLVGIVEPSPRVAATRSNRLLFRAGRPTASLQGGEIQFHEELPADQADRARRLIRLSGLSRACQESASGSAGALWPEHMV